MKPHPQIIKYKISIKLYFMRANFDQCNPCKLQNLTY